MDLRPRRLLVIPRVRAWQACALAGCALAGAGCAEASAEVQQTGGSQTPSSGTPAPQQGVLATLEQCQASGAQSERSATFAGEMTSVAGTVRMQMRIDVEERAPADLHFHTVHAPGLGVWRSSAPGVKSYKYLKQVTNLSAPASYRAAVRFRWLNADGRLIKASERRTPACFQASLPLGEEAGEPTPTPSPPTAGAGAPSANAGTGSTASPTA